MELDRYYLLCKLGVSGFVVARGYLATMYFSALSMIVIVIGYDI